MSERLLEELFSPELLDAFERLVDERVMSALSERTETSRHPGSPSPRPRTTSPRASDDSTARREEEDPILVHRPAPLLHRLNERMADVEAAFATIDEQRRNLRAAFEDVRELQERLVFGEADNE